VILSGYEWLSLSPSHAALAGRLPRLSGDPFDRMLAAQGLVEPATIISKDPAVAAYGAVVAW
jgi:PIN domain nuclease of toxin-antitoxin system